MRRRLRVAIVVSSILGDGLYDQCRYLCKYEIVMEDGWKSPARGV